MQEWLNWHAWKACIPLKGIRGSNPLLSADKSVNQASAGFALFSLFVSSFKMIYELLKWFIFFTSEP